LKRDDIFDPDRLRVDEERLRRFYFNNGYADFQIISAVSNFNREDNSYSIDITVEEGERYTFGTISVDNALSVVDDASLQDAVKIRGGDTYSAKEIERTVLDLTKSISEGGYPFAEVTPRGERNFENRTIDITFFVDDGPRTYIERIEVVGNDRTRSYVIRREFDVSEGDAYNRVLVNQAKRRLEALGFFESVRITTRPGSAPDRVVVVVTVADKSTGDISFGGGFSSTSGAIGEVSLSEKNFLGRGQFLKLSAGIGEETEKYELSFTEPYFLGRRIAAGFDFSRETTDAADGINFNNEITLFRLRASAPITERLRASVNYTAKYEELEIDDVNDFVSAATQDTIDRSPFFSSSVGYGLVYNSLDSNTRPRNGIFARFDQQFAGVGGDAEYVKSTGRLVGYYLLSEDQDIVLKGVAGAGNITPFGNDTLRVSDHFFQGGAQIRGFDNRGFGPRDTVTDEPLGGLNYWHVTAEVEFPLPLLPRSFGVRGAVFADAGSLFGNDFNGGTISDDAELRASVGASLIWDSPFGALRVDYAQPIAEADFDETEFLRFGISQKF